MKKSCHLFDTPYKKKSDNKQKSSGTESTGYEALICFVRVKCIVVPCLSKGVVVGVVLGIADAATSQRRS